MTRRASASSSAAADWRAGVRKIRSPLGFRPTDPPPPQRAGADREMVADRVRYGERAIFVEKTINRKLAPTRKYPGSNAPSAAGPFVCTTSVSIQATCPDSCVFKTQDGVRHGCFADAGFTNIRGQRMDKAAAGRDGLSAVAEEAWVIRQAFRGRRIPSDGARGGRDLRIHVGGDAHSAAGAELLAGAAADWKMRGGGAVWTFTHLWREIPRRAWGPIAVLASVETARARSRPRPRDTRRRWSLRSSRTGGAPSPWAG